MKRTIINIIIIGIGLVVIGAMYRALYFPLGEDPPEIVKPSQSFYEITRLNTDSVCWILVVIPLEKGGIINAVMYVEGNKAELILYGHIEN